MASVLLLVTLAALGVMAVLRHAEGRSALAVLVLAGVASYVPGIPQVEIEPEIILSLVMPPLLYSAALQFSFFSFMRNLRPILGLGVGLVVVTTFAVGGVTTLLAPGLGMASALVLAAVVSPPDTVIVVSKGRELGLPRRVMAILTGESLVNDAAALTILAVTLAQVTGDHTFIDQPVVLFLYDALVGALIGIVLGSVATQVRTALRAPALETAIGVLMPFTAFLLAEEIHASGVIAVVMAGFSVNVNASLPHQQRHHSPLAYRTRLQEAQVWPVIDTLLEAFVYAYMGLQLRTIVDDLRGSEESVTRSVLLAAAVLFVVIVVRVVWVFWVFGGRRLLPGAAARMEARANGATGDAGTGTGMRGRGPASAAFAAELDRRRQRREERLAERRMRSARLQRKRRVPARVQQPLDWRELLVVSWVGMRGIVTLAAAGSIPLMSASGPFQGREQMQFVAFTVAAGTLLLQGLTLPWLLRRLAIDVSADEAFDREHLARGDALLAALPADAFDARRDALTEAVILGELDDDIARVLIQRVDLSQAAAHAADMATPEH